MRYVAFDPGGSTGFCEAIATLSDRTFQVVKSCTIDWSDRFKVGDLLQGTDEAPLPDAVIVESFRLYQHRAKEQIGSDFPSSQVIGMIEMIAWQIGILDKVVYQPASNISRVQVLPEHKPSVAASEHARDAYRHLRYYILTNKLD